MERLDRPTRLIAYDTDINIQRRMDGEAPVNRMVRPRTLLYSALIVAVGAIMTWSLSARTLSGVNVLHDRNPEYVMLADGGVRNAYTVRILNKRTAPRDYAITVEGLQDPVVEVTASNESSQVITVAADQGRELRVVVSVAAPPAETSVPVTFVVTNVEDGEAFKVTDNFRGPGAEQ
jgi:polyferredoxin